MLGNVIINLGWFDIKLIYMSSILTISYSNMILKKLKSIRKIMRKFNLWTTWLVGKYCLTEFCLMNSVEAY